MCIRNYLSTLVNDDNEDPRTLVLDFVREHKGCMKEHVVEGLKSKISRVPVLNIINELLTENSLINKSENRRDHKLFVNTDNLLVSVPEELEEFEKAYLNLLENSLKRINEKDFSAVSKLLNIHESDPTKWNEPDMVKYSKFEFERWKNSFKIAKKNLMAREKEGNLLERWCARIDNLSSEITPLIDKLPNKIYRRDFLNIPVLQINKLFTEIEREISNLDTIACKYSYSYDIREFEVSLLINGALAIFYLLRDTLFYRSILIWPNTVSDKETLKKLYTIVYTAIANLQMHLVKFLSFPRVRLIANPIEFKNPIEYIIRFTETPDEHTITPLLCWYYEMGMIEFVEPIAASISRINREIKDHGHSNPMFQQLEKGFGTIDKIKEASRTR